MEIGTHQREGWPKTFVFDDVEYKVNYSIREPTASEIYDSGGHPMKLRWIASTQVSGIAIHASTESPTGSVLELARQTKKMTGSKADRVFVDLPLETAQERELSASTWFIQP